MSKISKKDLINQIKMESNNVQIPDLKDVIKSNIDKQVTYTKTYDNNKEKQKFKLKLTFTTLAFAVLLFALVISIPFISDNNPNIPNKINTKETFMVQAASLFSLARNDDEVYNKYDLALFTLLDNDEEEDEDEDKNLENIDYDKISDKLLEYLNTVNGFFNKDNSKCDLEELTEGPYKYRISIKLHIETFNTGFVMYFNETKLNDDDEDDIDEVSSKIEGYITDGKIKYPISGKKEVEKDECEVEINLFIDKDKGNFIKVSQEIENRENEYSYDFYENNKIVKEIEIELDDEKKEKSISLSMEDYLINTEEEYEFTYINNIIKASFEDDNNEIEVNITQDENNYYLDFGNNIIITKSKNNKNKKNTNNTNKISDLIVL